jgi:hypothetical protein
LLAGKIHWCYYPMEAVFAAIDASSIGSLEALLQ